MHYQVALRVLTYLKQAPVAGLFSASFDLRLKGYVDSNWGACPNTRRSISGYCSFLGPSLISWKSKKQTTVSHSSSKAEYKSLAQATCENQWLLYLLQDFQV